MKHNYRYITTASSKLTTDEAQYITAVGPYDILCGRDKNAFNNIGNRRFRVTISLWLSRYISAPSRQDKSEIIHQIREVVKDTGGMFLKRSRGGVLVELTHKQVHEKIGHALRDMVQAKKNTVLSADMDSRRGVAAVSYIHKDSELAPSTIKKRTTGAPSQRASTQSPRGNTSVGPFDGILRNTEASSSSTPEMECDGCSICNSVERELPEEHGKTIGRKRSFEAIGQELLSGQSYFWDGVTQEDTDTLIECLKFSW